MKSQCRNGSCCSKRNSLIPSANRKFARWHTQPRTPKTGDTNTVEGEIGQGRGWSEGLAENLQMEGLNPHPLLTLCSQATTLPVSTLTPSARKAEVYPLEIMNLKVSTDEEMRHGDEGKQGWRWAVHQRSNNLLFWIKALGHQDGAGAVANGPEYTEWSQNTGRAQTVSIAVNKCNVGASFLSWIRRRRKATLKDDFRLLGKFK